MITLEKMKEEHYETLKNFYLNSENIKYTILPKEILDITKKNPNKTGVVILKDKLPVGFFVLHVGHEIDEFIDSNQRVLLRSYSIDEKYHRQGIATKSMLLLDDFIHEHLEGIRQIVLAVNMKNKKAIGLYQKTGFNESHRRMGKKGEQMVMIRAINNI